MRGASSPIVGSCRDERRVDTATLERWCCEYSETRDRRLRDRIVEHFDWLVGTCTRQIARRGEPLDDLVQVGRIGLLKALDRFDPAFGVQFRTFASATISGELRRHYRGAWKVKITRGLQERHLAAMRAIETLTASLQRSPTAADIAHHLSLTTDEVIEAVAVGSTFSPIAIYGGSGEHGWHRDHPGNLEFERAEWRTDLTELISLLPRRERDILYLRFYREMTQAEIAEELGVSQVHVSRLLRAALSTLRDRAEDVGLNSHVSLVG
jgi:RNA polymerase sigma-B factor